MHRTISLPSHVWNEFFQQSIGFDKLLSNIEIAHSNGEVGRRVNSNYPPFNILKTNNEEYEITIAVAGFEKDNLEISLHENILNIKGEIKSKGENNSKDYLFKGIGERVFRKTFSLNENAVVSDTQLKNGILTITINIDIPEEKKPKIFKIK